jgi:hypothetical protein
LAGDLRKKAAAGPVVDDFVVVGKADTAVKLTEEELAARQGGAYWEDVLEEEEEEEEEEEYLPGEGELRGKGGRVLSVGLEKETCIRLRRGRERARTWLELRAETLCM